MDECGRTDEGNAPLLRDGCGRSENFTNSLLGALNFGAFEEDVNEEECTDHMFPLFS